METPARETLWPLIAAKAGFKDVSIKALPGDASFRRYARLNSVSQPALIMDAPPPREDIGAYLKVHGHLQRIGLRVPRVYFEDRPAGFAVIEDFGHGTFTNLLADGESEEALYLLACDVLRYLHNHQGAAQLDIPPYDAEAYLQEVALFADWYAPWAKGKDVDAGTRAAFMEAWREALKALSDTKPTLVLRDYHVDNLMLLPGEQGVQRCGLLDFQDARIGHTAYDLVSLVEDARRDVTPSVVRHVLERYTQAMTQTEKEALASDMAVLAAQRHTKVLGIFVRLWRRDGKRRYLAHMARIQKLLARSLNHPLLADVAGATSRLCPDWEMVSFPQE